MTTWIADFEIKGYEMERPFLSIYVAAATEEEARALAMRRIADDEVLRGVRPLEPIIDDVRAKITAGGRMGITWKDEGSMGPVTIQNLDEAPPEGVGVGIPFGSDPDWMIALPWTSRRDAQLLAKCLGLTLGES